LKKETVPSFDEYPFALPVIRALNSLEFTRPVTFFVGENGSGKSTLLEATAIAWDSMPTVEANTSALRLVQHMRRCTLICASPAR